MQKIERLRERVEGYLEYRRAASTQANYARAWARWVEWCEEHGAVALPATSESVAMYVADMAERLRYGSMRTYLAAVSTVHVEHGHVSPVLHPLVKRVLAGVRRAKGVRRRQVEPITLAQLGPVAAALPNSVAGRRDRALLLLGWAAALRRAELVALDLADLEEAEGGFYVWVRRSKTDQLGAGARVPVTPGRHPGVCPVRALRAWLDVAGVTAGPVFRAVTRGGRVLPDRLSKQAVAKAVKRAVELAGLDPRDFSGHSLRAGFATSAAMAGLDERDIAKQTRHADLATVRTYIRRGNNLVSNPLTRMGFSGGGDE